LGEVQALLQQARVVLEQQPDANKKPAMEQDQVDPAGQAMVPAIRNRVRAVSRKLTATHRSAFMARIIDYLFLWGRSIY
jgi:hypothetical protein